MHLSVSFPRVSVSVLALLCLWSAAEGQDLVAHDLPDVAGGRAAWADYDGDGDLDLALMGEAEEDGQCLFIARLFFSEGGTLVEDASAGEELVGTGHGDLAWADYDGDGDLDLLIAGRDAQGEESLRLYTQDEVHRFKESSMPDFTGVRYAAVAWGDIDLDGDLDLIVTGHNEQVGSTTSLYRNVDGLLSTDTVNTQGLLPVHNGDVTWVDFESDGDLDIALTGESTVEFGVGLFAEFYQNSSGTLSLSHDIVVDAPLRGGTQAWADFDNDGDVDLALSGRDGGWSASIALYRNESGGLLRSDSDFIPVTGGLAARLAWLDYDGDGDVDLAAAGATDLSIYRTVVFSNTSGTLDGSVSVDLPGLAGGDVDWADFDLDGHIELLVLGVDSSHRADAHLYGNLGIANQAPEAPGGLQSEQAVGGGMQLSWLPGSDRESSIVRYNLRIGTLPGSHDILSGAVAPGLGATAVRTTFELQRDLQPGSTYYWSVQSVDGAQALSPWSSEVRLIVQSWGPTREEATGLRHSTMAWGDYDNDGDPDLIAAGLDRRAEAQSSLYANDAGALREQPQANLPGVRWGAVSWADYDNDGNLDLALIGLDNEAFGTDFLYRNDGTNLIFQHGLTHLVKYDWGDRTGCLFEGPGQEGPVPNAGGLSDLDWGDFDNDGDQDLVVTGGDDLRYHHTVVLRNLGEDGFSVAAQGVEENYNELIGVQNGEARWGDYDNDGDLDLAVVGSNRCGLYMRLYRNEAAELVDTRTPMEGLDSADLAWGDYDGDGDLDLVAGGIAHSNGSVVSTTLYRNDDGHLNATSTDLTGIRGGDLAWADYDNDQDLDLVAIGNNVESTFLFLYENTGSDFVLDSTPGLIGLDLGEVSLVDYDVDGDLDLMTIGRELSSGEPRFHINDNLISQVRPNAPPEPPSFDGAIDSADVVLLSWLQATDAGDPTPQSLSYDLRMGRNPGVWDVISGVTDAGPGQVGANLFRRIEGLANGTYYWAVRTVDDGLARSEWNASRSFLIDTLPPILIGSGADSTSSDINGFKLSTDRAGIGQTLILNLVFSDQHSGVNTDVLPAVTAEIAGQRFPFEMLQFTGETWSGHLAVGATMPSGTGSIFVEGVVDNKGNRMAPFEAPSVFVADTQSPSVITHFPPAGGFDVEAGLEAVTMAFTKALDPSSLTQSNFQIRQDGRPLPIRIEATDNPEHGVRLVFEAELRSGTQYTVDVSAGLRDQQGNHPASDTSWTFATHIPKVVDTDPVAGAQLAPGNRRLEVSFSGPLNSALVGPDYFLVFQDGRNLPLEQGEFLYDAASYTVRLPNIELASGSTYDVSVLPGIGGPLDSQRTQWRFATSIPQVVSTRPSAGAVGVAVSTPTIQITLSSPAANLDPEAIWLHVRPLDDLQSLPELLAVTGLGADDSRTLLRFSPAAPLEPASQYEVNLEPRILGEQASDGFSWTFSTANRLDDPVRGGRVVGVGGDVMLYFPPAALGADAGEVSIQLLDDTDRITPPTGAFALSPSYRIDAGSAPLGKRVTLTMQYDVDRVAADVHPAIFELGVSGQWHLLGGTTQGNRVSTVVERLGVYTVFATESADGTGPAVASLSCQPRLLSPRGGGFAMQTDISFVMGRSAATTVAVYDAAGHLVRRLADSALLAPGAAVFSWDGRDDSGQYAFDGPYVVVVQAAGDRKKEVVVVANGQR